MEEIKQETKQSENILVETKAGEPKKSNSSAIIAWSVAGALFIIVIALAIFLMQVQEKYNQLNSSDSELSGSKKNKENEKQKQAETGAQNSGLLKVLVPNGGEVFCLEQPNEISWNAPPDVQTVVASLDTSVTFNRIGEFPAISGFENGIGIGKKFWNMKNEGGFDVPEGDVYKITLTADYNGQQIRAVSDGIFSVKKCQQQTAPSAQEKPYEVFPPETSPQTVPLNSLPTCTRENSCKFRTPGSAFRCNAALLYSENGSNWCECSADCNVIKKKR
jgi:hypothetical protein